MRPVIGKAEKGEHEKKAEREQRGKERRRENREARTDTLCDT